MCTCSHGHVKKPLLMTGEDRAGKTSNRKGNKRAIERKKSTCGCFQRNPSLYQPRIQVWYVLVFSPPPSLSRMDPAAVAQIAQMGMDLFVLSLLNQAHR